MNKNYCVITFGCAMNQSDSERVAAILEDMGYRRTLDPRGSDLIVINACSVRQSAIDRVFAKGKQLQALKKEKNVIGIVTGCILQPDQEKLLRFFDVIIPISHINELPNVIKSINNGVTRLNLFSLRKNEFSPEEESYFKIFPKIENKITALVPISNGCNMFCSFCVVPYTRGREYSRDYREVVKECKISIEAGAKEIVLLGQIVNAYKDSNGIDFAHLLKMIDALHGDFWITFQSPYPIGFNEDSISVIADSGKIEKFLNLPLQSGNDNVLKRMNRRYSVKDYKEIVAEIRKKIPNITLATDIIVGFCGETKKEFLDTVKIMKELKFDMAYIARYSPRPGTVAERFFKDNVPPAEKKKRQRILTKIVMKTALENSRRYLNKTLKALLLRRERKYIYGKTFFGKTIVVPYSEDKESLMGKFVDVKIRKISPFVLFAEFS